jgi:hypothetical protein
MVDFDLTGMGLLVRSILAHPSVNFELTGMGLLMRSILVHPSIE